MNKCKTKPLGNVLDSIKTGSTPSTSHPEFFGGDVAWFTPSDIGNSKKLTQSSRYITRLACSVGEAPLFEKGTLLVTCIGNIGRVGILQQASAFNQQITALKFCDEVNGDFAYYWFILNQNKLERAANQAIVPILNNERLKAITFEYPPLPDQQRIAAILDKADRVRRLRRYALELGETYLQSVFLQMFGDPMINIMGWDKRTLKELGRVVTGSTPSSSLEGMFGGVIPFITPGDLEVDTLHTQRFVTESGAKECRIVKEGSTMVCCIGATIGKMDKARTESAFNQQINAIEWYDSVNNDFGLVLMKFHSNLIAIRGSSTTLPILKKSEFEEISVPVPPLPLQHQFAAIVRQHERLRAQQREAARLAEHLFQALLQRAFRGEV